jgi:hypothetical protein
MPIRIDDTQFEQSGRLAGIAIAAYTMRAMEHWRANLTDYDCVMILISVLAISAERLLRADLPPQHRGLATPVEPAMLGKVNISSIAHATGLNRETTRRKVNDLVAQGLLARGEDGSVVFGPGLVQDDRTRSLIRSQLAEIAAVANQLIKFGVFAED